MPLWQSDQRATCRQSRPYKNAKYVPSPITYYTSVLTEVVFGFAGDVVALIGECVTVSLYNKTGNTDNGIAAAAVFFLFLHIAWYVPH
jgi:hypothetical protein